MPIRLGDFWVADIPFTDRSTSKKRPVLVLWLDGLDAVVAAVTSAAPRSPTGVVLADWRAARLRVPSTVRLSRLDCLEQSLLLYHLGVVSPADAHNIKNAWSAHVQPQF
jgi:mRNA interferase MazF